jgi:hypothetical protein
MVHLQLIAVNIPNNPYKKRHLIPNTTAEHLTPLLCISTAPSQIVRGKWFFLISYCFFLFIMATQYTGKSFPSTSLDLLSLLHVQIKLACLPIISLHQLTDHLFSFKGADQILTSTRNDSYILVCTGMVQFPRAESASEYYNSHNWVGAGVTYPVLLVKV